MYTKGENRRKKEESSILQVKQKACNCCNLNKKMNAKQHFVGWEHAMKHGQVSNAIVPLTANVMYLFHFFLQLLLLLLINLVVFIVERERVRKKGY
ncbi:hypothetical protein Ahy_A09g046612 isoform C [Arachis hypogaea]|uniref:Uncharacterized protein n=1 Tax=Arachis hypogaea TaxID=3818 RepID=A0A445BQA7_ARAHY|nr:hypothetical protein Ahy_A09g046612 isoform C [Arachis hypogaea]